MTRCVPLFTAQDRTDPPMVTTGMVFRGGATNPTRQCRQCRPTHKSGWLNVSIRHATMWTTCSARVGRRVSGVKNIDNILAACLHLAYLEAGSKC